MEISDAVEPQVVANEVTVPLLPCVDLDATVEFYEAIGFVGTFRMSRPYLYLALNFSGFTLHFGRAPAGLDPGLETSGGCLLMVDAVAPYHHAFTVGLRQRYGKVLSSGLPRITRLRPGQSRFTVVDPSGNSIIVIQRDEPEVVEYGGSKALRGLERAIDNAGILREFKNDDRAAARVLDVALRRADANETKVARARALADRLELAMATGDSARAVEVSDELRALDLTLDERQMVEPQLDAIAATDRWFSGE